MPKPGISDLSPDLLKERKKGQIKRYFITLGLLSLFTLYLGYLDLIKKSEFNHTDTYYFILIGAVAITIEVIYKTRRINRELRLRNKK